MRTGENWWACARWSHPTTLRALRQFPPNLKHRFRVEQQIVRRKQPLDRRAVDFHLRAADPDRAVADDSVTLFFFVGRLNPRNSSRRHGVQIDRHAQAARTAANLA